MRAGGLKRLFCGPVGSKRETILQESSFAKVLLMTDRWVAEGSKLNFAAMK